VAGDLKIPLTNRSEKQHSAILLAGGLSRRMGRAKADLQIKGESQIQRLVKILHPLVKQIVVMLAEDQNIPALSSELQKVVTVGRDSKREKGPLQAVSDAIHLLQEPVADIYLLACDLPYLNQNWLFELSSNLIENVDGVCTMVAGYKNPLLACYRREVIISARGHLERGDEKLLSIWEGFKIKFIKPAESQQMFCRDMNTPAEYKQAQEFFNKKF
jgi:molybdopterin-guanine dinucleotide biosynthesis protein A